MSWREEPAVLGWPAGPGFWAVTSYADVRHVSRTPSVYFIAGIKRMPVTYTPTARQARSR